MLRRSVRQRKEYLYQKSLEERETESFEKKKRLREALENNKAAPTDLRGREGTKLRKKLDLHHDASGSKSGAGEEGENAGENTGEDQNIDNEYAYLGVKDPKIVITTAREPSSKLMQFVKELRLLFPGAQRINRGSYVMKDLVDMSKKNDVTDIVICHEHRGIPDGLIISHLPYGPTCYFGVKNVVLRHDLPEKPENMSESAPNLVFHNFESKFGKRVSTVLKALFPPSAVDGKRVMSFCNNRDTIHFRHYNWGPKQKTKEGEEGEEEEEEEEENEEGKEGKGQKKQVKKFKQLKENAKEEDVDLKEVGPRFSLQLYRIELGTLEMKDCETEWVLRPYMNKQKDVLA